jgi:hypothetical protein
MKASAGLSELHRMLLGQSDIERQVMPVDPVEMTQLRH